MNPSGIYYAQEQCVKCGHFEHKVTWISSATLDIGGTRHEVPEHIVVECGVCGFAWYRWPKDRRGGG